MKKQAQTNRLSVCIINTHKQLWFGAWTCALRRAPQGRTGGNPQLEMSTTDPKSLFKTAVVVLEDIKRTHPARKPDLSRISELCKAFTF